jgi:hypothetical protein
MTYIRELKGVVKELCVYPEYEYWDTLVEDVPNIINPKYTPDLPLFEDTVAFNYHSYIKHHDVASDMVVLRVCITSPPHLNLPPKLLGEAVMYAEVADSIPIILEQFTLTNLNNIEITA